MFSLLASKISDTFCAQCKVSYAIENTLRVLTYWNKNVDSILVKRLILIRCKLYGWAEHAVDRTSQSREHGRLLMLHLTFHCCKAEGVKQDACLALCLLHAMVHALILLAQQQQQQQNLELAGGGEAGKEKDEGKGNILSDQIMANTILVEGQKGNS